MFQPEQLKALMGNVPPVVNQLVERWTRLLNCSNRPLIHRMRNLDVEAYLPGAVLAKVDRMSMQFALEVRCPLMDVDVAAFAATLTAEDCVGRPSPEEPLRTKRLLKDVLCQFLPAELVHRKKTGFGFPLAFWDRQSLLQQAEELLESRGTRLTDYVERKALKRWLATQHDPVRFSIYQLWPMLILELWLRKPRPTRVAI
jgi:asparagine synthase (glutamine-hydrolysing)